MIDPNATPPEPCALLADWLSAAEEGCGHENFNTMMLATASPEGRPSVRAVLFKEFDQASGRLTFYTNHRSRKAREIEANPNVAVALHWDRLGRQVRIEGEAKRVPAETSDEYFAGRPRDHQIGAWASDQSQPLESWADLIGEVLQAVDRFADGPVDRPPHWGGYAITPATIEFWEGGSGRLHQRVLYTADGSAPAGWSAQWLYP